MNQVTSNFKGCSHDLFIKCLQLLLQVCIYFCRVLEMGCYGLGVSRILQASVEVLSDGKHIRWPRMIAPYQIVIIPQKVKSTLTCTCFFFYASWIKGPRIYYFRSVLWPISPKILKFFIPLYLYRQSLHICLLQKLRQIVDD